MSERWEKPVDIAVATGLTLVALIVYCLTLTPTVAFWDSGEFIATSYVLGIPHPPGTPLYVLIGRVFTLLPVALSVAAKVNLLSAVTSALAVGLSYLTTARILAHCGESFGTPGWPPRPTWIARVGAGVGAGLMAFSDSYWTNAIESEVYALSSLVMVGAVYVMLKWRDMRHQGEPYSAHATKLVVLVFYALALSIAFHMGAFMVFLPLVLFFLSDFYPSLSHRDFVVSATLLVVLSFFLGLDGVRLAISGVIVAVLLLLNYRIAGGRNVAAIAVALGLMVLWVLMMREMGGAMGSVVGLVLAAAVFWAAQQRLVRNNLGFWIAVVFVLGLSVHLYLPIRAALDPPINEADPSTLDNFLKVLSRDQYKPVDPWHFRASLATKFDRHFWQYWKPQYELGIRIFDRNLLAGLPFVLGALGAALNFVRSRRTFLLMGFIILVTSIGLIWHLNFAEYEVRSRDYFFVALFHFFTIWIGIGVAGLLYLVKTSIGRPGAARIGVIGAAALLALLPIAELRAMWFSHDRSDFYIARDYAYNILQPLERDAIIFTNGDNDTFPLWYLQEVEGIRKDVRVACLSLLNTDWYIQQCRDQDPKVPISWTDAQISQLYPFITADYDTVLIKDIAVNEIVRSNRWQRPLYIAVSVPDLMGFDERDQVQMEGLVWRLTPQPVAENVDVEILRRNLDEVFEWDGLLTADGKLDSTVYRDENTSRLCQNYAAAFVRLGEAYDREARRLRQSGDVEGYRRASQDAIDRLMTAHQFYSSPITLAALAAATVYYQLGEDAVADSMWTSMIDAYFEDPSRDRNGLIVELLWRRGSLRLENQMTQAAMEDFTTLAALVPELWEAWEGQANCYLALGQPERALEIVRAFVGRQPNHPAARAYLDTLQARLGEP